MPSSPTRSPSTILQSAYGSPHDVLWESDHAPLADPREGEVQIQVLASSINPIDWHMIEGNRRLISRRTFPFTPLFDVAGVVEAVGRGVTEFAVGDRVYADNETFGGGGSAYVNVTTDLVARMPAGMGFAEAAALPLAAQTALTCIDDGKVTGGSRIAVIGASGGVGHLVVQMARARGAHVVGVSSARNHDLVRGFGAHEVVDRRTTDLAASYGPASFDVVVDTVGGRSQWTTARRVLRPGGRFVTISRDEDGVVTPAAIARLLTSVTARRIRGAGPRGIKYVPVFLKSSRALLTRVTELVEAGAVSPHIARILPLTLDGVLAGIEESRTGRTVGKLVVAR